MNARESIIHMCLLKIYDIYKDGSDIPTTTIFRQQALHTNYARILKNDGRLLTTNGHTKWNGLMPSELYTIKLMAIHSNYSSGYQKKIQSGTKSDLKELHRKINLILEHLNIKIY